jgi:hypothetical protein
MKNTDNRTSGNDELATLQRIEELVTVIAKTLLSDKLAEILKNPKHRLIYEGAGRVPIKELAEKARVSFSTVSGLWQQWERQGLMVKDGKSYRPIL